MASYSVPYPKSSSTLNPSGSWNREPKTLQQSKISFQSVLKSKPSLLDHQPAFSRFEGPTWSQSSIWKVWAQRNEVASKNSSNSAMVPLTKLEFPSPGENNKPVKKPDVQNEVSDTSSISAFMTQVADLVKLVDSRDIAELELKHLDCEIVIRKKEALPQPETLAPVFMMQPPSPQSMLPSQSSPAAAPALPAPASAPPAPAKMSKSSHPPLQSPMAGTFYRCPAPGEPPFVKVGDKVQKGQVVCIIEAMKLMNDIEADQSGTIVEILAEDGKPVSMDTLLLVIEP